MGRFAILYAITSLLGLLPAVAQGADAEQAVKHWLTEHSIPLRGVEAGRGFEDLQPLKKVVGTARIVSLGEATHGTREFFQLKHRMLEFLVSEMGFTVFAIEATMPEAFDVNRYVLTGEGDPAQALAGLYFWTWDTEEVLDLIRWMRRYNADPQHTKKVRFYGFDMQSSPRAARVALNYLRQVDPASEAVVEKTLAPLADPFLEPYFANFPEERKKAILAAAKTMLKRFDEGRHDFIAKTSADQWAIARQHAQVLVQYADMYSRSGFFESIQQCNVRDRAMADNVRWILDREGPDAKMVLWAHNGHVETKRTLGNEWMGLHLRKMYGPEMVVWAFAFNQGSFQAKDPSGSLRPFHVGPAPGGSLDAMLASTGLPLAAIDLRTLPKDGPVAKWFGEPHPTREIGALYSEQSAGAFLSWQKAPQVCDALLFVESTASARQNPAIRPRPDSKPLTAPANLDFEDGLPGGAIKGWSGPAGLNGVSYEAITVADRPFSGKRFAMIRRTPGPHYGETYGRIGQTLDATPYRGRRVRLRAAVRTDVTIPGSQAHLWLHATSKGLLSPLLPLDNAADSPISTPTWQRIEIVGEVPNNAETLSFGLALTGDGRAWLDSVSIEAGPEKHL